MKSGAKVVEQRLFKIKIEFSSIFKNHKSIDERFLDAILWELEL